MPGEEAFEMPLPDGLDGGGGHGAIAPNSGMVYKCIFTRKVAPAATEASENALPERFRSPCAPTTEPDDPADLPAASSNLADTANDPLPASFIPNAADPSPRSGQFNAKFSRVALRQ
jgi:hypothetical protein